MAFTRNGSTKEDYNVEQCMNQRRLARDTDDVGFMVKRDAITPGFGVYALANVPRDYLDRNAVDVESALRGTRANDFVRGTPFEAKPDYRNTRNDVELFTRLATFTKISPIPCVDPKFQEKERPPYY